MTDLWGAVRDWVMARDVMIDLITVWALAVGFAAVGAMKTVSWWTLRGTHDTTDVGRELKWQKASEAVLAFAMSLLYSLTLVQYYDVRDFDFWDRLWIRGVVVLGMVGACIHGARFILALGRERFGRTKERAP